MNLRILLARRISKRLARAARVYRRALSDHLRQETSRIRKLEIRSRGLRLYAAWSAITSNVIQTHAEDWHKAALPRLSQKSMSKHLPLLNQLRTVFRCFCATSPGVR